MKFFEDFLTLPPVWDCLHGKDLNSSSLEKQEKIWGSFNCTQELRNSTKKLDFNKTTKNITYKDYMSQLSHFEMNLLYSAYYEDFELFGYNPCDGLE